jgi:hypothetical protein
MALNGARAAFQPARRALAARAPGPRAARQRDVPPPRPRAGKDFAASLIINGITLLVCVILFSYLRLLKYFQRFYSPKR